jgi:hypothetical protein
VCKYFLNDTLNFAVSFLRIFVLRGKLYVLVCQKRSSTFIYCYSFTFCMCPYQNLPLIPALSKFVLAHIFTSYFSDMHFNIFHQFIPQSHNFPFSVELTDLQFICISCFVCETYMTIPSQYSRHIGQFVQFLTIGYTSVENTLNFVNITVK